MDPLSCQVGQSSLECNTSYTFVCNLEEYLHICNCKTLIFDKK